MPEDPAGNADAAGFRGGHELLLPQGEDLAADQTGHARPAQKAQDQHQVDHSDLRVHAGIIHGGAQDDDDGHGGDAVEDIYDPHDEHIHPLAEIAGETAQDHAQHRGDDFHDEADDQRHSSAVHQAGHHVHAVAVRTQPVFPAGGGVGIENVGLLALEDGPALGVGVVADLVVIGLAVRAGVDEVLAAGLDTLNELVLEVPGQEHVAHDGVDNVAADIGHLSPVLKNAAVLGEGIVPAALGKGRLVVGIGLQRGELQRIGDLLPLGRGTDNVLIGNADVGAAPDADGVEVRALLCDGVVHVLIAEAVLVGLDGQHQLGLQDGAKFLSVSGGIAELGVLDDTGVGLLLDVIAVELLVLLVGGQQSAQEGEEEHEGQDHKAGDGDAVPEKALGHQGARGQNLHPAVIVEGVLLALGAGLGDGGLRGLLHGLGGFQGVLPL